MSSHGRNDLCFTLSSTYSGIMVFHAYQWVVKISLKMLHRYITMHPFCQLYVPSDNLRKAAATTTGVAAVEHSFQHAWKGPIKILVKTSTASPYHGHTLQMVQLL